jgi:integrase
VGGAGPDAVRGAVAEGDAGKGSDFLEFETFVAAAAAISPPAHLIALLGGEVGLRSGEMRALAWTDIDFAKRQVCVAQERLARPSRAAERQPDPVCPGDGPGEGDASSISPSPGPLVLYRRNGSAMPEYTLRDLLLRVGRLAILRHSGPHMLRHTFCSHLIMRGAHVTAVKELAGCGTSIWRRVC